MTDIKNEKAVDSAHDKESAGGRDQRTRPDDADTSSEVITDWVTLSSNESQMEFEELGLLDPILNAIEEQGWKKPTPVQQLCLPTTVDGRDVAGFAQTGTGKTGVFVITIAQRLLQRLNENPRPEDGGKGPAKPLAVVLAPTRELAMQIEGDAQVVFAKAGLRSHAVYGGMDYAKQVRDLKQGVEVIVATPGRLMDYCRRGEVSLDECSVFVCDEADRMFDMGFIEDVEFFLDRLPEKSQKLLFSATTNDNVKELAFEYLEHPTYVSVSPETITPEKIEQHAILCSARQKLKVLLGLIKEHEPECAILFTNTKLVAEWLHFKLVNNGIEADLITGDLPQRKRIALIKRIKEGKIKALIATDVASRGLHISRVTHVYNFDLPDEAANYVHRIGRTARAGARGHAYSLVCEDYGHNLEAINELIGDQVSLTPAWFDESFLTIEDKAGNPFAKKMQEHAEARSSDREDRRPRQGRASKDDRGRQGGRRSNGDRQDTRKKGGSRDNNSRRDGQRSSPNRRPNGYRSQERARNPRRQDKNRSDQRLRSGSQTSAPVADKGFVSTIKKVFSVVFGKRGSEE